MGTLYLVATPIGNLEDMSPRAVRILREASLIAAEDTRHTGKLLKHFAIETPITSYFRSQAMHCFVHGFAVSGLLITGMLKSFHGYTLSCRDPDRKPGRYVTARCSHSA